MKTLKSVLGMIVVLCLMMCLAVPALATSVDTTETSTEATTDSTTATEDTTAPEDDSSTEVTEAVTDATEEEITEDETTATDTTTETAPTVSTDKNKVWRTVLLVLEVIASVALIIVVLLQSGKESGLGSAISGNSDSYMSKNKKGSLDKMLASATKWVALAWIIITLVLGFV